MNKTHTKRIVTAILCVATAMFAAGFTACDDDEACEHEWNSGVVTREATCTEDGVTTYTCTICGETKTESIAATGHTYSTSYVNTDADGHYHTCSVCGAKDEVVAHTMEDVQVLQAATETEDGVMETACSVCGYESTRAIPATAESHTASTEWKYDEDYHWHECSEHTDCGITYGKAAHNWDSGEIITAATCSSTGKIKYTCTDCGVTKEEDIPVAAHEYDVANGTWTWETDYSGAKYTVTCKNCNETYDYTADVKSEITTAATATEAGERTYTASVTIDGNTYTKEKTETIPATGHNYDYANGTFNWASDYLSATYTVSCTDSGCTATDTLDAVVTSEITTKATTNTSGEITYTATFTINGITYKTEDKPVSYSLTTADFASDFSTTSSTGTWSYGAIDYAWDSTKTYTNGSESFDFTALTELNSGSDGWTGDNREIKAGWISAGAYIGISYTASSDMTAYIDLTSTGCNDDTVLSLRVAVVKSSGTAISFISTSKTITYTATLNLSAGDTVYFIFNNDGSGYPQADLSIKVNELSVIADFVDDFSLTSSTGTWSYGAVTYAWDTTLSHASANANESFDFEAFTGLNDGSDGWTGTDREVKAGWINVGAYTGIAYTASDDGTVTILVDYTGTQTDTELSLRMAVVSADGTVKSLGWVDKGHSLSYSTTLELEAGDTVYFIFANEGSGYPQADLSITVYEAVSNS